MAESFLQHAEHYMRILTAAQAHSAPQRREEEREPEPEADYDAEAAAAESGGSVSESLAVIGGDDGAGEMVATPESLSSPQRQTRRRDGDPAAEGEEPPKRRTRRNSTRKPKSADPGAEPSAETEPSGEDRAESDGEAWSDAEPARAVS